MPFNPANPVAAAAPKWADAFSILGATLRDVGGAIDGNPTNALAYTMAQRERERLRREQQLAGQELTAAVQPQQFASPTGPNNPAPAFGSVLRDPSTLLPAIMKAAQSGVDVSPLMSMMQSQQSQRNADRAFTEQARQFDIGSVDRATQDVNSTIQNSLDRGERRNENVNRRNFEREQGDLDRQSRLLVANANNPTNTGPFAGTSLDAQAMNILLGGDPSSPVFAAAYSHLAAPKMQFDPQTGQLIPVTPDMSAYRKPAGAGIAPPPMPSPAPAAAPPVAPPAAPGQPTIGAPIQATAPKATDAQTAAAGFADRAHVAQGVITKYADTGTSTYNRTMEGGMVGNYLVGNEAQLREQGERDFLNAVLRRESGAVINPDEFENGKRQYFPMPGDGKDVLEQKRKNRDLAVQGLIRSAGPAYKPTQDAPKSVPESAVQHLRQNPNLAPAFDAKYGAAASRQYLGQ